MKKIVLSVALAIGLGVANISAQTVSGGIKAESNTSGFILNDMDNMKSKLGFGATIGGFGTIEFNKNFAFRQEMLLHYKNSVMEEKTTGIEMDYQYFGVEIPMYAIGQLEMGSGKGFVGIGPYVGFGIDARYKTNGADDIKLYDKIGNTNKSNMQRMDIGAGLLLGYEFSNKLQINAGYKVGFLDALDSGKKNATMLNHTINLGLAYTFGKRITVLW